MLCPVLQTPCLRACVPSFMNSFFKCNFWFSFSPQVAFLLGQGWLTHQCLPLLPSCEVFLENSYSCSFPSPDRLGALLHAVGSSAESCFWTCLSVWVLTLGWDLHFISILPLASPSNNYVGLMLSILFLLLLCCPHSNILSTYSKVMDGVVCAVACCWVPPFSKCKWGVICIG